ERIAADLTGVYRDAVYDRAGRLVWDSGLRKNAIVASCYDLLAGLIKGQAATTGITGLFVGAGDPAWDQTPPAPLTSLFDGHPYLLGMTGIKLDFLQGANTTATPTNRLRIEATLDPNIPTWPDANHAFVTLREFALVATL